MSRNRRALRRVVALVWALHAGTPQAQSSETPLPDTDLVLLELRLGPHPVAEALPGYQRGRELLLPLGELAKLLTLAIRTDPERGTATGFVLQEDRGFHLDAGKAILILQNRKQAVPPDLLARAEDDLYVAASLLSQWLPLDLDVDLLALTLNVKPREPLPLQRRLEREQRAAGLRAPGPPGTAYDWHESPYRWFDIPFADATLAADFRHAPLADSSDTQYSLFLTGDLLRMEAALYAGRTAGRPEEIRATLGRTDPEGRLLGPLHARTFALGSVVIPGVANVARTSPVGYGAMLGNRPLTRPTNFDRHSLQGDLPPGWDVELYFNDALVGFQQSGPQGRYEFNDLPLLYGTNEFRLVFHGPQGQLRVERESFLLEDSLIPAGSFQYQLAWHSDPLGRPRALAQVDFGFSRRLSATAGLYGLTRAADEVEQRYGFGGLRLAWGPFLVNGDAVRMEQGGSLTELGLKTRLGGLTLGLSQDRLEDFRSDFFPLSTDPIRTRDALRADGALNLPLLSRLPVAVEFRRDRLESGAEYREAGARISAYVSGTSLTSQYRWQSLAGLESADGALQISRRVAGTGVRGQVNYLLQPEDELSNVSLVADRALGRGYQLNLGVSRGFIEPQTFYTAGLNKVLGDYALGISASYSTREEGVLGARLFMALGRDPRSGRWLRNAQPMADTGAVSARVFLDRNLNGVHDADERPVPGAEFVINGARSPVRSDAEGRAYLSRLMPRQFADIAVDPASLEDPQWTAQPAGLRLLPRPGHVAALDFPVIMTSEIDGTVYTLDRGVRRGVGGVEFELHDRHGAVVRRATSASDGFYIVPAVPPGEYLLVSPDHIRRFLREDTGVRLIRVPADGEFVSGVDFVLDRRGTAMPAPLPVPPAPAPAERYYTVQKGDWLWAIAKRFYGEATTDRVNAIIEANRGLIPSTGELRPGTRILIPTEMPAR